MKRIVRAAATVLRVIQFNAVPCAAVGLGLWWCMWATIGRLDAETIGIGIEVSVIVGAVCRDYEKKKRK